MAVTGDSGGMRFRQSALQLSLAIGLGVAVFVTAVYCLSFPRGTDGVSTLWIVNGLPLAALLRTSRRQWPLLVLAAITGNAVADIVYLGDSLAVAGIRSGTNAIQFGFCAYVLRRRFGAYFDLTDLVHLRWLAGVAFIGTLFKSAMLPPLLAISGGAGGAVPALADFMHAMVARFIGTFVLALPILAITSRHARRAGRIDLGDALVLAVLIAILVFAFGPYGFPSVFIVTPVLMLLAWRRGLGGAGIGALITIVLAGVLSKWEGGLESRLVLAGFSASERGVYMELFFFSAILTSLPLAVARARQQAMEDELKRALTASELRAVQLAESEAAARAAEAKALRTEAKALESEALALQAEQKLRNIIETSSDIICMLDREGRFIEISDNCEAIWGWSRETLMGRPCTDFMRSSERALMEREYRKTTQGSPQRITQNTYVRPDGSEVSMSWTATWIEQEQISYCIGHDMTEYNALAAQAQLSQRMEAIGQLTGGVAHDFNNLLTVVIGSSETIAEESNEPQLRNLAELILKAAQQGGELTRQLLAFSRRQPLDPRPLDINALLDGTAPLIRRTLGADLQFSIETSVNLRRAFVDPTQTEAAILNLCLNARDAMPNGGRLMIRTENVNLSDGYDRRHPEARPGDYVAIHVSDTGTGIEADVIERVFEPFFTTKETGKGSGLGLSMVYGFIQQSGGFVDLATELGKGSTFTLFLPVADDATTDPIPAKKMVETVRGGAETVLIVEDNDLVREHVRSLFASLGYQVVVAATGAEALQILEDRNDIDLLFTDIVMPGGMNGRELGEMAEARWPALHILYTSGYSRDALTQDGRLVEGVSLLSKPYSKAELAAKVRAILDSLPEAARRQA